MRSFDSSYSGLAFREGGTKNDNESDHHRTEIFNHSQARYVPAGTGPAFSALESTLPSWSPARKTEERYSSSKISLRQAEVHHRIFTCVRMGHSSCSKGHLFCRSAARFSTRRPVPSFTFPAARCIPSKNTSQETADSSRLSLRQGSRTFLPKPYFWRPTSETYLKCPTT
jgi:hypothetical protein